MGYAALVMLMACNFDSFAVCLFSIRLTKAMKNLKRLHENWNKEGVHTDEQSLHCS